MRTLIVFLLCAPLLVFAYPQEKPNPRQDPDLCLHDSSTECGWWWKMQKPPAPVAKKPPPPKSEPPQKKAKINCQDPKQWRAPCGFVDPGHSYEFQAQQRDALRRRMVMNPRDPKAVRGFQKYNLWMLNQAIGVLDMWQFNVTQDPSLNPALDKPTSRFGLQLMMKAEKGVTKSIYSEIKNQGGYFVWFTRSDCEYCHGMLSIINMLIQETNIPVHNASLDEDCMKGFVDENCVAGKLARQAGGQLSVRIVPDLMLYLPNDGAWIRLATGVETLATIEQRIKLFVGATKAAYENAVVNAQTKYGANVDFMDKARVMQNLGMAEGIPAQADTPEK